jgi:hypothetical protein
MRSKPMIRKTILSGSATTRFRNGIHATGAVAATALMQFCGISSKQAVDYWKVGIAPKVQYPSVIHDIQSFQSKPNLELTPDERDAYCPGLAAISEYPHSSGLTR